MEFILSQINVDPRVWLVLGGLLVLVGVFKIVSRGLSLFLWAAILVIGVSMADFGLKSGGVMLPPEYSDKFAKIIGPGKKMTKQTLRTMCTNLLNEPVGTTAWCEQVRAKQKSTWSRTDVAQYAESCIISDKNNQDW
jgi:hypothetical protein